MMPTNVKDPKVVRRCENCHAKRPHKLQLLTVDGRPNSHNRHGGNGRMEHAAPGRMGTVETQVYLDDKVFVDKVQPKVKKLSFF
jgi:hypothetical protein